MNLPLRQSRRHIHSANQHDNEEKKKKFRLETWIV